MKGTNKLLMSVVALVITLAMATTATYAWFTTNGTASVGGFDVNVSADGEGLYIRNSGTGEFGMTTTVNPSSDLKLAPVKVVNTSSALAFTKLSNLTNAGFVSDTAATEGKDYYKFSLDFSSTKAGSLKLSPTSTNIQPKADSADKTVNLWKDYTADKSKYSELTGVGTVTSGSPVSVRAAWAARIALVAHDVTAGAAGTVTIVDLWADGDNNLQLDYVANLMNYTWEQANKATLLGTSVAASSGATSNNGTLAAKSNSIGTLDASNKLTVDVYIWIDGTDSSCFNTILADIFTVNLAFICE